MFDISPLLSGVSFSSLLADAVGGDPTSFFPSLDDFKNLIMPIIQQIITVVILVIGAGLIFNLLKFL